MPFVRNPGVHGRFYGLDFISPSIKLFLVDLPISPSIKLFFLRVPVCYQFLEREGEKMRNV